MLREKSYLENAYLEEIDWVIENHLDYLKRQNDICGFDKVRESDISMLEEITDEDKEKIVEQLLNDDQLNEEINNAIRYYIFHS